MLVRFCCSVVVALAALASSPAQGGCADEISRLMSKDTEKLTTRYNRITRQIEKRGASPKLLAEECRIARQLTPRLEGQLAAIKQSGCIKDPEMGSMVADIIRGHEDDLAMVQRTAGRAECR